MSTPGSGELSSDVVLQLHLFPLADDLVEDDEEQSEDGDEDACHHHLVPPPSASPSDQVIWEETGAYEENTEKRKAYSQV